MNEINDILNDITCQTISMFGNSINEEDLTNFRRYLEDIVLFDIIRGESDALKFYSVGREVSQNIRVALIASGLSRDGRIPEDGFYKSVRYPVTIQHHYAAKLAAREHEEAQFKSFKLNVMCVVDENLEQPEHLNVLQFVTLGIAQNERNCGYVEAKDRDIEFCERELQTLWNSRKKYLEKNGLDESLEYAICCEIFKRPQAKHYPLATAVTLCEMAATDEFVRINGADALNPEYVDYVFRNLKAAKITDYDVISKYEKNFREVVRPKNNEKKVIKTLKKETGDC